MARFGMDNKGRSWVSFDQKEIGGAFAYLLLAFIGIIIIISILSIPLIIYFVGKLFLAPIVNSTIVKITLFPSLWDKFLPAIEGQLLLRAFLLAITFFILKISKKFVESAWLYRYIIVNQFILSIRVFIFMVTGIIAIFTGNELFGDREMLIKEYNMTGIISENVVSNHIEFYSEKESNDKVISDIHGNTSYNSAQYIHFQTTETFSIGIERFKYSLEGFFDDINFFNTYSTIISYAPTNSDNFINNQTSFLIRFIGDGKLLHEVALTPEQPVVKVRFAIDLDRSLEVEIEGNLVDESIVTFLNTEFSLEF